MRRGHRDGLSIRELADKHRVHRRAVRQAIADAVPLPRKTPTRVCPVSGPFESTKVWVDTVADSRDDARRIGGRLDTVGTWFKAEARLGRRGGVDHCPAVVGRVRAQQHRGGGVPRSDRRHAGQRVATSRAAPRAECVPPFRSRWATITGAAVWVDTVATSALSPRTPLQPKPAGVFGITVGACHRHRPPRRAAELDQMQKREGTIPALKAPRSDRQFGPYRRHATCPYRRCCQPGRPSGNQGHHLAPSIGALIARHTQTSLSQLRQPAERAEATTGTSPAADTKLESSKATEDGK